MDHSSLCSDFIWMVRYSLLVRGDDTDTADSGVAKSETVNNLLGCKMGYLGNVFKGKVTIVFR